MWTLQDAKNRFSAVVDAALSGTPQEVSRRGKPAVVVLSALEYRRLVEGAVAGRESFARHLLDFPGEPEPQSPDLAQTGRPKVVPRDVSF